MAVRSARRHHGTSPSGPPSSACSRRKHCSRTVLEGPPTVSAAGDVGRAYVKIDVGEGRLGPGTNSVGQLTGPWLRRFGIPALRNRRLSSAPTTADNAGPYSQVEGSGVGVQLTQHRWASTVGVARMYLASNGAGPLCDTARKLKFQGLCIEPVVTTPAASRHSRFGCRSGGWGLGI